MSIGKEEREAVLRVLDRGILSGFQGNWSESFYGGPEIRALETEWANYFNTKHAVTCNSATSGLWLACAAIGLKPGDECVVTCYSMTCSASIPLHFGAKPVFADIESDYYCLDPKDVEAKITPNTKAIIVVDIFGQPYDADAINAIADKYSKIYGHKIYVIEDAAQSIGAKYKGKYAGTLGDIGVYSLNRHKHIQCGEGGIVVTDNDELAFALKLSINHAEAVCNDITRQGKLSQFDKSIISLVGMNMRMTELQACIAREQLKKLAGILKVIRDHAKYFDVKVRPECESAYYRYTIQNEFLSKCPEIKMDNDPWNKFNYKSHYIDPIYRMPLFKSLGYPDNLCPVCEAVEENIVLAWLKEGP